MLNQRIKKIEEKVKEKRGKRGKLSIAALKGETVYCGPELSLKDLKESMEKYYESMTKDKEIKKDA